MKRCWKNEEDLNEKESRMEWGRTRCVTKKNEKSHNRRQFSLFSLQKEKWEFTSIVEYNTTIEDTGQNPDNSLHSH